MVMMIMIILMMMMFGSHMHFVLSEDRHIP